MTEETKKIDFMSEEDAAVVFRADGTVELVIPAPSDDMTRDVPIHILAATEIMMVASEAGVDVLAEEFEVRVKQGH